MDASVNTKPGFSSHKTIAPIPYQRRWHRDLLIQCTLSPACHEMAPIKYLPRIETGPITLSFAARATPFSTLVCASEERFQPHAEEIDGALVLFISRYAVFDPIRLANARTIWAARNGIVPLADRLQMKTAVSDQWPRERTIEEIFLSCPELDLPRATAALLKLACEGVVWISSDRPFDLKSMVFSCRAAAEASVVDLWTILVNDARVGELGSTSVPEFRQRAT